MAFQWSRQHFCQTTPGGTVVQMTEATSMRDSNWLTPGHLNQVWNCPRDWAALPPPPGSYPSSHIRTGEHSQHLLRNFMVVWARLFRWRKISASKIVFKILIKCPIQELINQFSGPVLWNRSLPLLTLEDLWCYKFTEINRLLVGDYWNLQEGVSKCNIRIICQLKIKKDREITTRKKKKKCLNFTYICTEII